MDSNKSLDIEALLASKAIPEDVKNRIRIHNLSLTDIIANIDALSDIPVKEYGEYGIATIANYFSQDVLLDIIRKHPEVIKHFTDSSEVYGLVSYLNVGHNTFNNFVEAVKQYFVNDYLSGNRHFRERINGTIHYNPPHWISSLDFEFKASINSTQELLAYNEHTVILNTNIQNVISTLGIENIRKFNAETGYFSYKKYAYDSELAMLNLLAEYIGTRFIYLSEKETFNFFHGSLSYDDFKNEFAKCLDVMRSKNVFGGYDFGDNISNYSYDFIEGSFRREHPEIFIDKNAPQELRKLFYRANISPIYLMNHQSYIPYIIDKKLYHLINANIILASHDPSVATAFQEKHYNFIKEYTERYGNEAFLDLVITYGGLLTDVKVYNYHNEIENKTLIEKNLMHAIYQNIIDKRYDYYHLRNNQAFVNAYPDIFLTDSELASLESSQSDYLRFDFYRRTLSYEKIRQNPEFKEILKNKNLYIPFQITKDIHNNSEWIDLIKILGNEKFLELCVRYGQYFGSFENNISKYVYVENNKLLYKNSHLEMSFEGLTSIIEESIYLLIASGKLNYDIDAPQFLKEKHRELFLSDNAPEELKNHFYGERKTKTAPVRLTIKEDFNFMILSEHKDWLPYLVGKDVLPALIRSCDQKESMTKFFHTFGKELALKLGVNRPETVMAMIVNNKVDLMWAWYEKTGRRFIPDWTVMTSVPLTEADKFLASGHVWANLMKIKNFSLDPSSRTAMLKLAYTFGAFDQDTRGTKKLIELLTSIPRRLPADSQQLLVAIDEEINKYSQKDKYYTNEILTREQKEETYNQMLGDIKDNLTNAQQNYQKICLKLLLNFFEAIHKEGFPIDFSRDIFSQIYHQNETGEYTLAFNQQLCPKVTQAIREILDNHILSPNLTPKVAADYFEGFSTEYNPEFREILLANLDSILKNEGYLNNIAEMQRRFEEIQSVYRNVPLTFELALNYIKGHRFADVDVGNDKMVEDVSIKFPSYSQADFDTLQKIYNYGKKRVFSSIPKIAGEVGDYIYEMLDLTDSRALIVGYLTDCCQRLGEVAELCMEHSMVDKHGRVFVIRDKSDPKGIIAQSWVWRNRDILCFDNIEVPDRQMWDHGISRGREENYIRNDFTDLILSIYQRAAKELMEVDEKTYHNLLATGKITEAEYARLRLGKITIGEGHSNIKGSLKTLPKDHKIARPVSFTEPVPLNPKSAFYVDDSQTQYIVEERTDRNPSMLDTITPYNDTYNIVTNANFKEADLLHLGRLETVTNGNNYLLGMINYTHIDKSKLVSEIGINHNLDPDTAKIVLHPNFAIIYDEEIDKIRLGSLLFNTKIDNKDKQIDIEREVTMQIYLALMQISNGRAIDFSRLDKKQKEMYYKAINAKDEVDIERGVKHGR